MHSIISSKELTAKYCTVYDDDFVKPKNSVNKAQIIFEIIAYLISNYYLGIRFRLETEW